MRKCPRCNHEIANNEKYCPQCGLDLQGRYHPIQKKKPVTLLMPLIIFFSLMTIPLLYSQFLDSLNEQFYPTNGTEMKLPEVKDKKPTAIIKVYTTLVNFQNDFSNLDTEINMINTYEQQLGQKAGYIFNKDYSIVVFDNNNVYFTSTYTTQINDQVSMKIVRTLDRTHEVNKEVITFQKNGVEDFEGLFLTEEEQVIVKTYTGQQDKTEQLMHDFSLRKEEFEKKKDTLGHYGIGNYDGESSFVAHRKDKEFYSKLVYSHNL